MGNSLKPLLDHQISHWRGFSNSLHGDMIMTKSELRILHWLSGTTKESYWDNDFKEMREGTSERAKILKTNLRTVVFAEINRSQATKGNHEN